MAKKISEERKSMYKMGLGMQIAGGCLFAGPFIVGPLAAMSGNIDSGVIPFVFLLAFIGFGLIAGGGFVRSIAARGKAGSGLVLDPEKAREDLQPWTEMGGEMTKDFLDAADIDLNGIGKSEPEKVIMIKCQKCGKLNEEDSKFCQECGKSL
jgi:hypothetical protein